MPTVAGLHASKLTAYATAHAVAASQRSNFTTEDTEAAALLELSKHVDRAFPTLSKFSSFKQLWQWYTSPIPGQARSPKEYEDANDASWRRGRANSKRWSEHRALLLLVEKKAEEILAQHQQQKTEGGWSQLPMQSLLLVASEAVDADWALQVAAKGGSKGVGTLSTYYKVHMKRQTKGAEGDGDDQFGGAAAAAGGVDGALHSRAASGSLGRPGAVQVQTATGVTSTNSAQAFAASMSAFAAAVEAATASHAAPGNVDAVQRMPGVHAAAQHVHVPGVQVKMAVGQANSNSVSTGAASDGEGEGGHGLRGRQQGDQQQQEEVCGDVGGVLLGSMQGQQQQQQVQKQWQQQEETQVQGHLVVRRVEGVDGLQQGKEQGAEDDQGGMGEEHAQKRPKLG
jgi:hypothetical protein